MIDKEKSLEYSYEMAIMNAKRHSVVHQYTTFEALEKIIDNKSLLLRRVDLLNDIMENDCLYEIWKKKIYVSCFTHRENESYFFWKTYAKGSSDGVMITFEIKHLSDLTIYPDAECKRNSLCVCKKTDLNIEYSPDVNSVSWGIYDYSCVDVLYLARNDSINGIEHHQGRIKYVEWDMERETRIRVALRPRCLEFKREGKTFKYFVPSAEHIYVKLSELCLESLVITLSPFASISLKQRVDELLIKNNLDGKVQVKNSVLSGEVK